MRQRNLYIIASAVCVIAIFGLHEFAGAVGAPKIGARPVNGKQAAGEVASQQKKNVVKVTFIELGSVNCIPCKMMQPVMKEIEKEYGGQVKVVFYDVWTKEGRPYGEKYKIRAIPTQIFLDEDGNEFFRHMGFFPKEDIEKVLKKQGIE